MPRQHSSELKGDGTAFGLDLDAAIYQTA